ncbi:MAG: hypothetical protein V2I43_16285, partial [Parvularcula sp.]|nr:hypothetical protein [Parvularcula sp.]
FGIGFWFWFIGLKVGFDVGQPRLALEPRNFVSHGVGFRRCVSISGQGLSPCPAEQVTGRFGHQSGAFQNPDHLVILVMVELSHQTGVEFARGNLAKFPDCFRDCLHHIQGGVELFIRFVSHCMAWVSDSIKTLTW